MSLPKSLKIFGQKFKVKVTNLNGFLGLCDRSTSTIYIEVDQTTEEKWHTLLHEIGHAIIGRVGITQAISPEIEEVIVEALASGLMENLDVAVKGSMPPPVKSIS